MSCNLPSQHNSSLSTDLLALSDLSPPSPVSSPTKLNTSWTWSDVEVEFDFDVDDDEGSLPLRDNFTSNDRSGLCILSSSSISTVCSNGTFGPVFKSHKPASATLVESHSTISNLSALSNGSNPNSPCDWRNDTLYVHSPRSPCRRKRSLDDALNSTSATESPASDHVMTISTSTLGGSNAQDEAPMRITNGELPISPALKNSEISPSYSETLFCSLTDYESGPTFPVSKPQSTGLDFYTRQLAFAATLATLEKKCPSEPSSPIAKYSGSGPLCIPSSNTSSTTAELLIDQEGFRSVWARFKHTGSLVLDPYSEDDNKDTMVQFRPIKRQTFRFHYAALEALPVLRRITVNGEESRDYTARQASLSTRTNGVYFVLGDETPCFTVPGKTISTSKLRWRFEYLVILKSDTTGMTSNGERLVTPLSFSCSPLLLHPLQGKRVRLVHVMKKSVIPKLVAQKMEPPNLSGSSSPVAPARGTPSSMPHSDRTHRHSYDSHKRMATLWTPRPSDAISMSTEDVYKTAPYRRRRASSAGERSLPCGNPTSSYVGHQPRESPGLCQNIVPPSCLARLIDSDRDLQETG
ncbi:hypothetical protein H0H92_002137 [Tricholoma furcatifolium]|nr:hypothetical protein H0H92_002137 [Tricholoma furcatifolium]